LRLNDEERENDGNGYNDGSSRKKHKAAVDMLQVAAVNNIQMEKIEQRNTSALQQSTFHPAQKLQMQQHRQQPPVSTDHLHGTHHYQPMAQFSPMQQSYPIHNQYQTHPNFPHSQYDQMVDFNQNRRPSKHP
jgi:hypothetical protein